MSRGPSNHLLQRVGAGFSALVLCLVMFVGSAGAYKDGEFPGKGSYQIWRQANGDFNEGVELYKAKRYDVAIAKFKSAIALYPYDAYYFINLGLSLERRDRTGDKQLAEDAYREAVKIKPTDWEIWTSLGHIRYRLHKFSDSKWAYECALRSNPPADRVESLKRDICTLEKEINSLSRASHH